MAVCETCIEIPIHSDGNHISVSTYNHEKTTTIIKNNKNKNKIEKTKQTNKNKNKKEKEPSCTTNLETT